MGGAVNGGVVNGGAVLGGRLYLCYSSDLLIFKDGAASRQRFFQ